MRWWIAAIGLVVTVTWVRGCTSSSSAYDIATQAEADQQLERAVEHYQYAARWYTPFASTPHRAAEALSRLALAAESRGDRALALMALRRLRGAILATRGLTSPLQAQLETTNKRLAKLTAAEQLARGGPTIRGRSQAELVADHLALLQLDPTPNPLWSLLVILSFLAWISTAALAIWRGLDEDAHPVSSPLWRWGGASVVSFVLWLVALSQA